MACDIHLVVEVFDPDEKWRPRCVPLDCARNYSLFSELSGVRGRNTGFFLEVRDGGRWTGTWPSDCHPVISSARIDGLGNLLREGELGDLIPGVHVEELQDWKGNLGFGFDIGDHSFSYIYLSELVLFLQQSWRPDYDWYEGVVRGWIEVLAKLGDPDDVRVLLSYDN